MLSTISFLILFFFDFAYMTVIAYRVSKCQLLQLILLNVIARASQQNTHEGHEFAIEKKRQKYIKTRSPALFILVYVFFLLAFPS